MLERELKVANRLGLHARAAAKLVSMAERFSACVNVVRNGETVVIGEGLSDGERVVRAGVNSLQAGQIVKLDQGAVQ